MRTSLAYALGIVVALGSVAGCGTTETSLLVQVISDDIRVPNDVDTISIDAHGQTSGHDLMSRMQPLPGPFPQTYRIRAAAGFESEMVRVTVTAFRTGAFSVRRVVLAQMVVGTSSTVVVRLERCCLGMRCESGVDCSSCLCQSVARPDGGMPDAGSCSTNAQCNDHVACTLDTCMMGQCAHMLNDSLCPTGQICDPLAAAHAALDGAVVDAGSDAGRDSGSSDASAGMDAGRDAGSDANVDAAIADRTGCAVPCRSDADCDDGLSCNGRRFCLEGRCGSLPGTPCVLAHAVPTCAGGMCAIGTCMSGWGDCDSMTTNGCETALDTVMNCGACRAACSFPNASTSCTMGMCTQSSCNPGFADCNGPGVDGCETVTTTLANCGGCGTPCAVVTGTGTCATGTCAIASCNPGYAHCTMTGHDCETQVNTLTDCAACGAPCTVANGTATCTTGTCAIAACGAGYGHCAATGHDCETQLNALANCGACGAVCNLPNATSTCTAGSCAIMTCRVGWADCDGVASNGCEAALNTVTDCGACGRACTVSMGTPSCATGTCEINSCNAGFANCGTGCIALNTLTNCGGCRTACTVANGTASCATGTCAIASCSAGFGHCTAVGHDCETALNTLTNCGACGAACSLANAAATCATGSCAILSCNPGYGDCDGIASNGCEAPLNTLTNCRACRTACTTVNGSATCATGTCAVMSCNPGYGHCIGTGNDCETRLNALTNCGGCGVTCGPLPNATASCATGACAIASCSAGYAHCTGPVTSGCETPLNTTANCNGCGLTCSYPNAAASCPAGVCTQGACNPTWLECNGSGPDGCETSGTTLTNCGGCGVACGPLPNATATCATGTCALASCNPGYAHCTGPFTNGCETPLTTTSNCGGCGIPCSFPNAAASCGGGVCIQGACNPGWLECNGPGVDGCETSATTLTNCGGCGVACGPLPNATATCATGACAIASCNAGFGHCTGPVTNGCESPLNTTTNCAGCGIACAGTCATGTCCPNATPITAPGGRFSATLVANQYTSVGCGGAGAEAYFTFTLAAVSDVFLTTHQTGATSAIATVLYVRNTDCAGSQVACAAGSDGLVTSALRLTNLAAGTYLVIADTVGAPAGGTIWLDAYISTPGMPSDRCGNPALIPAGATMVTGTIIGYTHDYGVTTGPGCPLASLREDRVYYFFLPTARSVTITGCSAMAAYNFDEIIYTRAICQDSTTQNACNDDDGCAGSTMFCDSGHYNSSFTATMGPGLFYFFSDGYVNTGTCDMLGSYQYTLTGF